MLITGGLAAEQRTAVAHSASYGKMCRRIFQAPAGAGENCQLTTSITFRAVRRSNILRRDSHSTSHGSGVRIFPKPRQGDRKPRFINPFLTPRPGLVRFTNLNPTVVTVGYYRAPLRD